MKYKFIDIHAHLDSCKDPDEVAKRAAKQGVLILAHGTDIESNREVLQLSENHENVKVALGIYPINALKMSDEEIDREIEFIRKNKSSVSAIGEVGIDFKEDLDNHTKQEDIFRKFAKIAMELDIPIITHSRKAEEKVIDILEELKCKKVIMHCFCGNKKLEQRIIRNGWFLTIPTSVTRTQQFQERARDVPLTQLFCETDSPYLHPNKGSELNNEPALVVRAYQEIAKIRKIEEKEVIEQMLKNFEKLFN